MAELIMRKVATGFLVSDPEGEEILSRIANGSLVLVAEKRPQNLAWRRRFHAMIDHLWACGLQDRYPTAQLLRKAILLRLGFAEPLVTLDGEILMQAQSMAFEQMDHAAFIEVWDRTLDLIHAEILPGLDMEQFEKEVDRLLDVMGDRRAA
jgi:hypothetical protein